MGTKRRRFSPQFKAKVALEALKEQSTLAELAVKYDLHPVQISTWKKELRENLASVFEKPRKNEEKRHKEEKSQLYEKIGRLEMELEWLKKKMESID